MTRFGAAALCSLILNHAAIAQDDKSKPSPTDALAIIDLSAGNPSAVDKLARAGAPMVPAVSKFLKDTDAKVRGLAALTLGKIGPAAKGAAPALAACLADADTTVASQAAQALARIGAEAAPAIAAVLKKDANPDVAVRAAEALRYLGSAGKESVPALIAVLKKPGRTENVLPIAEALGKIGPDAASAAAELARTLAPDYGKEGKGAALIREGLIVHVVPALKRIGPGAKAAVPALLALLKEKRVAGDPLALMILDALGSIGSQTEELTPILLEQIEKKQGPRLLLYRTLAKTGIPKKEHLNAIALGMRDKNPWVRFYAAALVGKLEPNDPAVVSVLIESLQEMESALRKEAAILVGALRPRDASVRDALTQLARDPDEAVRRAATEALKKYDK